MERYSYKAKQNNGEWIQWNAFSGLYGVGIDRATICQCTGMKDRNDDLIWENDIVEGTYWSNYGRASHQFIGKVIYQMGTFMVEGTGKYAGIKQPLDPSYEIIGNAFNPFAGGIGV